ncbi:hypothetical protein EJ03DRAFT_326358 [Teratosphaeria nubilosa]|uniref:RRM domain-containing protein n=1 Tax=Teratosphaeria nubilosa TaxID=161662 RepID=A0A6G1LBZ4_9PEZI|nr:hypothetical protein EJ03DRAFT_326358 [Teratosphaeria nubilosa]
MDRSLDEIIGERPQRGSGRAPPSGPRGPRRDGAPMRAPRREEYPRDGVRKPRQDRREDRINLDNDWVHDRFTDDDRYDRRGGSRRGFDVDQYDDAPRGAGSVGGTRLRVDNVHYDLTEDDLRSLFERKGRLREIRLLYDRMDRSQGTAFVTYEDHRDARDAIDDFDGQNANGQPIRITVMPNGPLGNAPDPPSKAGLSLFDRIQRPPRSLFDRMDPRDKERADSRDDIVGRRRQRSDSPRRNARALPENIDRYIPGRGSRSPIRRRGTPREPGRRPGARREESGRGARGGKRGGRTDAEGHSLVQGRPRKTAEELDAEMEDYWGGGTTAAENGNGAAVESNGAAPHAVVDGDEYMVL